MALITDRTEDIPVHTGKWLNPCQETAFCFCRRERGCPPGGQATLPGSPGKEGSPVSSDTLQEAEEDVAPMGRGV